jgi:hypothetical protein
MNLANDKPEAQLPHPDKLRSTAIALSALDIFFSEKAPVFTFEKNWHTEVSTLLVDTRDGGKLSLRIAGKAALIKGTRADAFMHPGGKPPFTAETRLGFITYPGLLAGFPAPLENLLKSNDSFEFMTFCLWHLHESGKWERGDFVWPKEVDDPDGSTDLFQFFIDPLNEFMRSSQELYGVTVKDLEALEEVFQQKPLSDGLLRRLGVRKPLQSFSRRLHEIEYGVEPYIPPEVAKPKTDRTGNADKTDRADKTDTMGAKASEGASSAKAAGDRAKSREEELRGSTKYTSASSIGEAIGDFFKGKGDFFKERSAVDIAQDALATALGAVTDVINQVPVDSPIRSEPLFKWQRLTGAKLMLARKVGMAGMLDTITAEFIDNLPSGRKRALVKFVDALEADFHTMPTFLNESLEQLHGFYQRASEQFQADAEIFKSRAERSKNKDTQTVKMLTDLPVSKIVCLDGTQQERLLNRLKRLLRDCGHSSYFISASSGDALGLPNAVEITLVSRETDKILEILRTNFENLEMPEGSYLLNQHGEKVV